MADNEEDDFSLEVPTRDDLLIDLGLVLGALNQGTKEIVDKYDRLVAMPNHIAISKELLRDLKITLKKSCLYVKNSS